MKFHQSFGPLIGSPSKLALLRTFFRYPSKHWTGRELGRVSGVSPAQTIRDLAEFAAAGFVDRKVVGRAHVWWVNVDHALVQTLGPLFEAEGSSLQVLLEDIQLGLRGAPFVEARVFGSIVRGDERADSDIDLYVRVRNSADRQVIEARLEAVRQKLWKKYGNALSPIVYTDKDARNPPNPLLLDAIAREGIPIRPEGVRLGAD